MKNRPHTEDVLWMGAGAVVLALVSYRAIRQWVEFQRGLRALRLRRHAVAVECRF